MPSAIEVRNLVQSLLGHIKNCTGLKEKSEWRRASFRFIWSAPAKVDLFDHNDFSDPLYVRTGTVSAHGMDFLSPRGLKRGQRVLITLEADNGEVQIPATVVHSTDWFGCKEKVGVKFDLEGSQHSSGSPL